MSLQRPEHSEATVPEVKELHAKMGQLAMENDFLAGRSVAWAVLDWRTRRVLTWRLSNSLSTDFCIEAVEEAVQCHGKPTIVNTDQGRQFTHREFVSLIQGHGIRVSMGGKGRSLDNVFVERLWKSLKYEEVYWHAYDSVAQAQLGLQRYFKFYNERRPHSSLDGKTPNAVYFNSLPMQ